MIFQNTIDKLKSVLEVNTDKEIAEAIGMNVNAFYNRKKSGSLPFKEISILAHTQKISLDWLFYDIGSMKLSEMPQPEHEKKQKKKIEAPPGTEAIDPDTSEKITELMKKTIDILSSPKAIYRVALTSNINAFHAAISAETRLETMESTIEKLGDRIAAIEAEKKHEGKKKKVA